MFEGDAFHELIEHAKTAQPMPDSKAVLGAMLAIQAERNALKVQMVREYVAHRARKGRTEDQLLSDAEVYVETFVSDFRRDFDVSEFYPAFKGIAAINPGP
jgi:hypothetical protein